MIEVIRIYYCYIFFMNFNQATIKRIVTTLKYLHLIGAIFSFIGFIFAIHLKLPYLTYLVVLLISVVQYYGLNKRTHWVVITILILSSLTLVRAILLTMPQSIDESIIRFLAVVFAGFNSYFFTNSEVRRYFKVKDTTIF